MRFRPLSAILLTAALSAALGISACAEDQTGSGGGDDLLVPDEAEERRFGDLGEPQGPTNEGADEPPIGEVTPDPNPVLPDPDNPTLTNPPGHSGSTTVCGNDIESEAFRLLNADRAKHGIAPLQCDDDLLIVGRLHCKDMFERNFFDHTNPDGEQPWDRMRRYGITGWSLAGENIASGQRSPAEVQAAWMNSPGHRANILTADFTHVGVAYFVAEGRTYWTQLFARF